MFLSVLVSSILVPSLPRLCYLRSEHSHPGSTGPCYTAGTYQLHPHTTSSLGQHLHLHQGQERSGGLVRTEEAYQAWV